MSRLIDLTGETFGRLAVVRRDGTDGHGKLLWRCYCDPTLGGCGRYCTVRGQSLRLKNGKGTRSCGCLLNEGRAENGRRGGLEKARRSLDTGGR